MPATRGLVARTRVGGSRAILKDADMQALARGPMVGGQDLPRLREDADSRGLTSDGETVLIHAPDRARSTLAVAGAMAMPAFAQGAGTTLVSESSAGVKGVSESSRRQERTLPTLVGAHPHTSR